jgi:hypothetical protein
MSRRYLSLLLVSLTLWVARAQAEEQVPADTLTNPAAASGQPTDLAPDTAPVLASDAGWAGEVAIVIAGLFLAAAVIGPIVRAEGESMPTTFSHHEDPQHHTGREPDPAEGSVE